VSVNTSGAGSSLREKIVIALGGFFLTGVVGTMATTWIQRRGWMWQNRVRLRERFGGDATMIRARETLSADCNRRVSNYTTVYCGAVFEWWARIRQPVLVSARLSCDRRWQSEQNQVQRHSYRVPCGEGNDKCRPILRRRSRLECRTWSRTPFMRQPRKRLPSPICRPAFPIPDRTFCPLPSRRGSRNAAAGSRGCVRHRHLRLLTRL
jgi:hypothetical protein